jgi:hypothetical protein
MQPELAELTSPDLAQSSRKNNAERTKNSFAPAKG